MEMDIKIKIGIVDDHAILCDSLKMFLNQRENIEVILTANSGEELLTNLSTNIEKPDIILLDIDMPKLDGITLLPIIKDNYPFIRVIMLSFHAELSIIEKTIKIGASGYVRKGGAIEDIYYAINQVKEYNFFLDDEVIEQLNAEKQKDVHDEVDNISNRFTERELEIIKLICKEKSTKQIADILNTSIKSIEYNRACLLKKIKVDSMVGLVYFAIKNNLD